jgi:hypothetical protein
LERGHQKRGFEDQEISKLREAITVLGYQLQNQGI